MGDAYEYDSRVKFWENVYGWFSNVYMYVRTLQAITWHSVHVPACGIVKKQNFLTFKKKLFKLTLENDMPETPAVQHSYM